MFSAKVNLRDCSLLVVMYITSNGAIALNYINAAAVLIFGIKSRGDFGPQAVKLVVIASV